MTSNKGNGTHSLHESSYRHAVERCLNILRTGKINELYSILPQIGVLRDESFLEPLLELLRSRDGKKREFAAHALGVMENPKALRFLYQALNDPLTTQGKGNIAVETAIIDAMGEIGSDEAVVYLCQMLNISEPNDLFARKRRELAIEALGAIAQQGGVRALEILYELLDAPDAETKIDAIPEIAVAFWHRPNEIPDRVLEKLLKLTADSNPSVRSTALSELKTLAEFGCQKAREDLTRLG